MHTHTTTQVLHRPINITSHIITTTHTHTTRKKTRHILKEGVLDQETDNSIGINIGSWAAILQVSLSGQLNRQRNADRGSTISNTVSEGVNIAGLVLASQAVFVTGTVLGDVLRMALGQALDGGFDGCHAAVATHAFGGVVGVGTGAVPVSLDGLGGKGGYDAEFLTKTVEQPASNHDLVTGFQGTSGANLEFPLTRHDLSVDTRDDQTGLDAGIHVGLGERATVD